MAAKKGNSPTTIIIGETNSPAEISTAPVRNLAVLPFCEERYFKIPLIAPLPVRNTLQNKLPKGESSVFSPFGLNKSFSFYLRW